MRELLSQFQLALSFLSRIPVGTIAAPVPSLARSSWAFGLVGGLIGGVIVTGYGALCLLGVPAFISAMSALGIGLILTGGLHEDGLADTADGFGGGANHAEILRIMKDSAVGSYGVLALIIVLGIRAGSLAHIVWTSEIVVCVILVSALSRLLMLFGLAGLPAARNTGMGYLYKGLEVKSLALPVAYWMGFTLFAPSIILISAVIMCGVCAVFMMLSWHRIKGQTGDVCGSIQILTETTGWISVITLLS